MTAPVMGLNLRSCMSSTLPSGRCLGDARHVAAWSMSLDTVSEPGAGVQEKSASALSLGAVAAGVRNREARRRPSPPPKQRLFRRQVRRACLRQLVLHPWRKKQGRTLMASEWLYTRDGKTKSGPVSSAQLKALVRSGQLLPTDMVRKAGMAQWTPVAQVACQRPGGGLAGVADHSAAEEGGRRCGPGGLARSLFGANMDAQFPAVPADDDTTPYPKQQDDDGSSIDLGQRRSMTPSPDHYRKVRTAVSTVMEELAQ